MAGDDIERSMRVLWVQKVAALGGAETLLLNSARLLDHTRFDVTCVFILNEDEEYIKDLELLGVTCVDLSTRRGGLFGRLVALMLFVRSGDWDIVHVHSPLPGSFARIGSILRRGKKPARITTEHNTWGSFHPLTRAVNALTIRVDDAVLAVSEETLLSMSWRVRQKAKVVIQGVIIDELQRAGREGKSKLDFGVKEDTPILVTVANFREHKDHISLLSALEILVARKVRFHSLLVGIGPTREHVASEIVRLGLGEHVSVLGSRRDIPLVLASSDLFVLASIKEGLPVAIMEALALGVPVVSTAVGGIPQALEGSGAAILVQPGEPRALANAIEKALSDQGLHDDMVTSAYLTAERFDLVEVVTSLEALYVRLASQKMR
jgi:glycosyltransferase involved in cell wall biosynthesis